MLATSSRLLRLLTLLQGRRDWSGRDLAGALQVDVRTVRRDIGRLRELGYRIDASAGQGGGYRLGAGPNLPPVLLSDAEAVTVMLALRAAAGSMAGMDDSIGSLLAKLGNLMPARLQPQLRAVHAVAHVIPASGALAEIEALALIATACRDRRRLRMHYRDRERRESVREVEPLQLILVGRRWYLIAWDRRRDDWRSFRIDRISEPEMLPVRFEPRALPEPPASFIARALKAAPSRYGLRVRLVGPYDELVQVVPGWCGLLEPLDDTSCSLRTGADTLPGLATMLLHIGRPFELMEDPPWRGELLALLRAVRRAVANPPQPA